MLYLFNFIYFIGFSLALPVLTLLALTIVPKWKPGLASRWGDLDEEDFPKFDRKQTDHIKGPIWFHAVSVGELNALLPLLKYFSGMRVVLSVTTNTAYRMAQRKLAQEIEDNQIRLFYMPWDHPWIIKNTIERVGPSSIILIESEIWPALIQEADKQGVPLLIINAKLSDKSFNNYKLLSCIFRPLFQKIKLLIAQTAADSRKFLELGYDSSRLYMMGNMKFSALPNISREKAAKFKDTLGYKKDDLLWVCGSTHSEEEALLVSVFQELQEEFPQLRLALAPRHPERFAVVETVINSAAKLIPVKLSEMKGIMLEQAKLKASSQGKLSQFSSAVTVSRLSQTEAVKLEDVIQTAVMENEIASIEKVSGKHDVLLVDTIGDLMDVYSIADIAFVGGTFNEAVGGHNVLEPATCAIPVISGPFYEKNTEIYESLEAAGGLIIAEAKEDLRLKIKEILNNDDKRILMGAHAKAHTDAHKKIVFDVAEKLKEVLFA